MRVRVLLVGVALLANACASETAATTSATTAITAPPATTATTVAPVASTTTTNPVPAATTTTTLFVPPAECAIELPETSTDEVLDTRLAVFADGTSPAEVWTLALGNRAVEMDTLGDRVYLATLDGFAASFDIDPCGLDWVVPIPVSATEVVATRSGVFVATETDLVVLEPFEGMATTFPLEPGPHHMVAGPDVLAVANGDSLMLYDYLTEQASQLGMGAAVTDVAAATDGVVVATGITVELRTWLGAEVWARDMPEPVEAVDAGAGFVFVTLGNGTLVALDAMTGEVQWEKAFGSGAVVVVGPVDRGELQVLEFDEVANHHHLALEDGSSVFVSESPVWQTFAEYDDGLVLVVEEGDVTARSLLEQDVWTIPTGADGLSRFTEVDVTSGFIVALSFSAERF
jgi:outer membrane protein assembly factor BamB